jgi:hypothetical protein
MNPLLLPKRTLCFAPLRSPVRIVPEITARETVLSTSSSCDRYGHVIAAKKR